ncbi:MAG: HsdM family class I SAM-dependent methyltransferase [Kiloniellales bacterium]
MSQTAAVRTPAERRALGAFYTPPALVDALLDRALDPAIAVALAGARPVDALFGLRVLDPACGDGAFLVPASKRLIAAAESLGVRDAARRVIERCIVGVDIDGRAVRACAERLGGLAARAKVDVRAADALSDGPGLFGARRFDAVVGNPPYLNQLEEATASSRATAAAVREWSGGVVKGYADAAAAFWLLSTMLLRDDGRCALVLPRSVLSTRDALGVRERVARECAVDAVWFDDRPVFDASVRVCAPVVRRGTASASTGRCVGIPPTPVTEASAPRGGGWAHLLPESDAPESEPRARGTLGEIVDATADFRDQYYGLRGCIVEDRDARARSWDDLERAFPRLITSGLIDRDWLLWGVRPARVLKRRWDAPRIDRARLERETDLGPWLTSRLVPKILLATQTRVLEPVFDEAGHLAPCVPVITITAKRGSLDPIGDLRRAHRALLSPEATAWAVREHSGAALSPGAIKLSAKQVLAAPLGGDGEPCGSAVRDWFEGRLASRRRGGVR